MLKTNLTIKDAEKLIRLARESISAFFEGKEYEIPSESKKEFGYERGVFVSLYVNDGVNEELNGCIGFPDPVMPLAESVAGAARSAAFEDPRFPPLKKEQMKELRVEISVLTEPEEINVKEPAEYLKRIKIGEDGLIVRERRGAGLLLPQVAVEWNWGVKEFLENTCRKAGLEPNCWKGMKKGIYKFQAQIFTDDKGKVVEKKLY